MASDATSDHRSVMASLRARREPILSGRSGHVAGRGLLAPALTRDGDGVRQVVVVSVVAAAPPATPSRVGEDGVVGKSIFRVEVLLLGDRGEAIEVAALKDLGDVGDTVL